MPSPRGGVLTDDHRQQFFAATDAMRDACIEVSRHAPIGSRDYRTASALIARLDDAVEALTNDRTALWRKAHGGNVPMRNGPVRER